MTENKHIYFASDFHLGYPDHEYSLVREKLLIEWLDSIKGNTEELFLVGDVFDFWFEYKSVIPKGYIRFLGKLAEFVDMGIPVHMFRGNHDMWFGDYLEKEIGVKIHSEPILREYNGKKFFIHHGHALGKYDKGMNFLNALFNCKFLQWMLARVHPNLTFSVAHLWSSHNRRKKVYESENYLGDEKEWLLKYSHDILKKEHFDYFIFGHRHVAIDKKLSTKSRYINLGNWITNSTYCIFDGNQLELKMFKPEIFPKAKILRE